MDGCTTYCSLPKPCDVSHSTLPPQCEAMGSTTHCSPWFTASVQLTLKNLFVDKPDKKLPEQYGVRSVIVHPEVLSG